MKYITYTLGIISIFNGNSMETNKTSNLPCCGFLGIKNNTKENIEELKKDLNPNTNNTKFKDINITVKNIAKVKNALKFTFTLNNSDKNNLLGVNTDNLTFYVKSNNEPIENVFKKWNNDEIIKNGTSLSYIKHSLLKMNRFFDTVNGNDTFSFSLKVNENFNIEKKISIYIKYKTLNNEEGIIQVKDINNNEEYTLFSLFYNDIEKYNELFDIIKDTTYCKKVGNFENSISINFKEDEKLLNNEFKNLLKIYVEDENGNELNDFILKKWVEKTKIPNGGFLSEIKKGLFILYSKNKYDTVQKPYSLSMFYENNSKINKIKIKIKLQDNKFFYVKNKGNEIIDLNDLEGNKNSINNNIKNKNTVENNDISEEEFINRFKEVLNNGISIEKVGNFKNSIKFKFKVDEKLLNSPFRKNIKIQYFNEKDELVDDSLLLKWINKEQIKNGTYLCDIKKGFLFNHPYYKVDDISKLFEISMFINTKAINDKVKIKISYNNNIYTYIKYKDSDILDLNKFI